MLQTPAATRLAGSLGHDRGHGILVRASTTSALVGPLGRGEVCVELG